MKRIYVYADWAGLSEPFLMGTLNSDVIKGEEVFSFAYDDTWLTQQESRFIDPDLKYFPGNQFLQSEKPNFGMFLDSAPDRWGRLLIKRRNALKNKERVNQTAFFHESDFLLAVSDLTRMGALRFKTEKNGSFLAHSNHLDVPPVNRIRELEQASLKIERDDFEEESRQAEWLNLLLMPGSSLGGARPKSNVRDTDGTLWIAKFPSYNDDRDVGAWEYVAIQMARELGIETPKVRSERFSGNHHTFLTRRFDRNGEHRLHFASAMTLLGYKDGDNHKQGVSYLEIIEIIEQYGCNPRDDIRELWKRIVLSVAISNSDDHLRNHGFLLTKDGWKLSPVYDINPEPMARGLSLNIDEQSNRLDYELCLDVAPWFRWKKTEAENFIAHTKATVGHWRHYAQKAGIRNSDQDITAPAFAR